MNQLHKIGLNTTIQQYLTKENCTDKSIGRIVKQFKDRYLVYGEDGIIREAEITGNLRFSAGSNRDFPAVGDWVLMTPFEESYIIQQLLPRYSILERKAISGQSETQVIATNLDYAFIVQALNQNFNLNRLERYLVMVNAGGVNPIIILNKSDLNHTEINEQKVALIQKRIGRQLPIWVFSVETGEGIQEWMSSLESYKTYCFIGSSGVGKSSLINLLTKHETQVVSEISSTNQKGRHTTTSREIFLMSGGAILIDSPGMRELGMIHDEQGIAMTFAQITELAQKCRFKDCTHNEEPGCAVNDAIAKGSLEEETLKSYQKIQKESARFHKSVAEKRKGDKAFGKMYKQVAKYRKKRKY